MASRDDRKIMTHDECTRKLSAVSAELRQFADRVERFGRRGDLDLDLFQTEIAAARAIATEPDLAYDEAREWEQMYRALLASIPRDDRRARPLG